jgi:hypothetical protein
LTALDLDGGRLEDQVHPTAVEIVEQLRTYSEISPSGRGIRIIGRGKVPGTRRETSNVPWAITGVKCALGIFDSGRYVTVTGDVLDGFEEVRFVDPEVLEALCETYLPPRRSSRNATRRSVSDSRARPDTSEPGRDPQELLGAYPRLARVARHDDFSGDDRARDWGLVKEARKKVPNLTELEAEALVRHVRQLHDAKPKSDRYFGETVAKAFEEADDEQEPTASNGLADQLNAKLHVVENPIVSGYSSGGGRATRVKLVRADGTHAHLGYWRELTRPHALWETVVLELQTDFHAPSQPNAYAIAKLLREFCETAPSGGDAEEMHTRISDYLAVHSPAHGELAETGPKRWRMISGGASVVVDAAGAVWIAAGPLMTYLASMRVYLSWEDLQGRLREIGFERRVLWQREPKGSRRLKTTYFWRGVNDVNE